MTKLIIAEALISDINEIKSEIDSDENIISISKNEFIESNNAALFKNESYQFVDDAFLTFNELKNFTLENELSSLEVFEEGENYLVVYGNV